MSSESSKRKADEADAKQPPVKRASASSKGTRVYIVHRTSDEDYDDWRYFYKHADAEQCKRDAEKESFDEWVERDFKHRKAEKPPALLREITRTEAKAMIGSTDRLFGMIGRQCDEYEGTGRRALLEQWVESGKLANRERVYRIVEPLEVKDGDQLYLAPALGHGLPFVLPLTDVSFAKEALAALTKRDPNSLSPAKLQELWKLCRQLYMIEEPFITEARVH